MNISESNTITTNVEAFNKSTEDNQKCVKINSDDAEITAMFDLKLKKKKKKDKDKGKQTSEKEEEHIVTDYDPPTYSYSFLLNKIYENFNDYNTNTNRKNVIKIPIVQRFGSKKTIWMNFTECSRNLNRDINHLQNFVLNELSTECNIDGNGRLILKGIYNSKNIEGIIRKYVLEYVQCSMCKSIETCIEKNNQTRLNFLVCLSCKSSRSIQQIKLGYKAITNR